MGGANAVYRLAWSTPTTPLPIDNDPRSVFERLFGLTGSTDPAARRARLERDRRMLDVLTDQVARLVVSLGPGDRVKLDEYLDSVRDVERRIQKAEEQSARELPIVDQPAGIPSDYGEDARLMMDLLALAYQTDLTRVSTFMLAREVSSRAYPEIGVADSHHPLSHHTNEPAKLARCPRATVRCSTTRCSCMAPASAKANSHSYDDLLIAVVGGKGAGVTGGRYVRYPKGTPLATCT